MNESKAIKSLSRLAAYQQEYINLLTLELEETCSFAMRQGWRSKRAENGADLRNKINYFAKQAIREMKDEA